MDVNALRQVDNGAEELNMKILFVGSSNKYKEGSPIMRNQGASLEKKGVSVDYFLIFGKGFTGYLRNIYRLRKFLKVNDYDIIHAHYGLSGIISLFSLKGQKLVVSFMGDDILGSVSSKGERKYASVCMSYLNIHLFARFYDAVIVKSSEMLNKAGRKKNFILIPNGVNMELFRPMDQNECRRSLSWAEDQVHILFPSDPARGEKNYGLAVEAVGKIKGKRTVNLHNLKDTSHDQVPVIMNASDVVILTSLHEGSPNVVKEALACNRPVVAVETGDTGNLLKNTKGCYLASYQPTDFYEKIVEALRFSDSGQPTSGRMRLQEMGLSSTAVAERLISVYNMAMGKC